MTTPLASLLARPDHELAQRFANARTLSDVADLLEVRPEYLRSILYQRRDRTKYRKFVIPKASGGEREIQSPPLALKILQRKLNHILSVAYKPKPSVHGYVIDRSIRTNAERHLQKRWVLNVDLENFFPSIHLGRVQGALMAGRYGLPRRAATVIAQICTTADGTLPQGAPSSPILSNIVCERFDGQMMALGKRYGLAFTRYCDDITLSTRQPVFPADVASGAGGWTGDLVVPGPSLRDVIEGNGFRINLSKSRLQSSNCHQEVTGITVNEFMNIPREYVRGMRGLLHAWRRFGPALAAREFGRRQGLAARPPAEEIRHFRAVTRGRIEYIGFVRGRRDPVYCRLRSALHALDPQLINAADSPAPYWTTRYDAFGTRWQRLFLRCRESVALAVITKPNGDEAMGTAFAVNASHLGTAAHNLTASARIILVSGDLPIRSAFLASRGSSDVDCAMIPLQHGLTSLPTDRRLPSPGEPIAIIGFASVPQRQPALGLFVGHVESLLTNYPRTLDLIHVSVSSAGGLSGAPMIDSHGRVLGVVVESVFEKTTGDVPRREYCTVLPISNLLDIDCSATPTPLPLDV